LDAGDQACYTLQKASTAAVASIFSEKIYDAIESSQLRLWEKDNLRINTTNCVQMEVWRNDPQRAIISLRIGFNLGMDIAKMLYAENTADEPIQGTVLDVPQTI
jgi:hypothetical protein